MRKEIQFRVKQDLKECTPAPADTSVIKDVIVDESKLTDSNSSNALVNNVGCNDNLKFTVKQEVDDVDYWEENQQSTIINNLDSNQNIKEEIKEVASYGSTVGDTCLIVGERLKSNGSSHMSPEVPVNNKNVDNINGILKEKVILPQPGPNYPNQYVINGNINLNSGNQANMSDDMQPVNLSVVKDQNSRENDYSTNHFRMGKRKRCSHGISSVTEDRSNTRVSVGMKERVMSDNSSDKMFCPMIFNPEFCKNSSYSQILKPTQTGENGWEQTTPIHSSYIEESSVPNSHLSYSHSHQSIPDEVGNSFRSSVQNRTPFMTYSNVTTSISKGSYDEKPTGVFNLSKSPIQDLYSDMSIHPSEITSKKIMRCSCDKCLSISPPEVIQGCDRCDNVPTYLHKMSENLNSTGEELFRRIEESLAETETLKSQEEELLKRIAKSLNEAETLKFKEEELLKKIERSLTEAESLKTREEEILRRIEVSLAKSETVRSQDDELFMKIGASLQNAQYSVTDEDTEFESKCNINLDFSLPLKKRKRLKTLIQKEDVKSRAQQNLSAENFPSYPSRPMISIAELLHKNVPVFEHSSATSPVSHYNNKPLYYRDVSMEPKYIGVLNCSNKNNMDSKMFSFCKSEGNRASCSYNGISNTSSIEDKVYKDLIKRESESPVLTEQNGMMNFNSGFDTNEDNNKKHNKKVAQKLKMNLSIIKEEENKELVCKLKMDLPIIKKENKELVCKLKMDLPIIKKEDNKEMNLRHEVESINKGKKCSLQDKNALDNENSSKSLYMNKDGEMKQEVCPINCEFIKKENIFD